MSTWSIASERAAFYDGQREGRAESRNEIERLTEENARLTDDIKLVEQVRENEIACIRADLKTAIWLIWHLMRDCHPILPMTGEEVGLLAQLEERYGKP